MKTASFKNTDIGPIPDDWEVKKLGELCEVLDNRRVPLNDSQRKKGPYPYCGANGIVDYIDRYAFEGKVILIAEDGGNFSDFATRPIAYQMDGKFWVNNHAHVLVSKEGVCQEFLFCQLVHKDITDVISGGTRAKLTRGQLDDLLMVLPPLPEQRRIAAALSDADKLVAALDKMIEKKKRVKEGSMQRLLSGETRLLGFGSTAFNQTELGPIPSDWEVKRLGEVCDIRTGKRNGDEQTELGLYPFFVRSNTVYRINSYSYEGEAILVPGEGGIGEIFHYINGRFDYHQRVYKISDFKKGVFAQFVYYFMRRYFGNWAKAQTVKATVDSLRLPTFEQFILLLPDFPEQRAIAAVLSDMDAEIAALSRERAEAERIKQGMMQELLTGKVRLT